MENKLQNIHEWKQTKKGLFVSAAIELLIAYGLASWAIDSGNLLLYLLTIILLVGFVKNLFKLVILFFYKRK